MAYGIRSQKFLCCLPVRIGVFILSFFQLLGYGAAAALFWYAIFSKGMCSSLSLDYQRPSANGPHPSDVHFDKAQKIAVIIFAAYSSILALLSFCGFIGSIFRSRSLVAPYSTSLFFLFGVSVALTIFWAITWFRMSKDSFIDQCINGSTDQSTIDACHHVNEIRFIALGVVILGLLVHLCKWTCRLLAYLVADSKLMFCIDECIIVSRYVVQLREEDDEKWRMKSLKSGAYSNVPARASMEGLTQPTVQYPYSDVSNSFGGNHSHA